MRLCGFGMILLFVVISGISVLAIHRRINPVYHQNIMIAYAAYSFFLITAAVIQTVRAWSSGDTNNITIRHLSLVAAIGVMLAMERAMLGTYGNPFDTFTMKMEAGSGAFAALVILLTGLRLVLLSNAKDRESRKQ